MFRSNYVVTLANAIEANRVKGFPYWEIPINQPVQFEYESCHQQKENLLAVTLLSENKLYNDNIVIREFEICYGKVPR